MLFSFKTCIILHFVEAYFCGLSESAMLFQNELASFMCVVIFCHQQVSSIQIFTAALWDSIAMCFGIGLNGCGRA